MDLALRFIWLWIGLLIFCILGFRIQWNFWILIKLFPICMGNFFAGAEHKRRPDARIFATYLCCAPFRIFFYNCQIFSILIYFSILDFSISLLKCTNDWNVVRWPLLAELRRVVGFFWRWWRRTTGVVLGRRRPFLFADDGQQERRPRTHHLLHVRQPLPHH